MRKDENNSRINLKRDYSDIENAIEKLQKILDAKKFHLVNQKKADLMQDLGYKIHTLYEANYKGKSYSVRIRIPKINNYYDKEAIVGVKFLSPSKPKDMIGNCSFTQIDIIQEIESEQERLDLKTFEELEKEITQI